MREYPDPLQGHESPVTVFLHGSGTGPWLWDEVRSHLATPSVALEVPSNRPDMDPDRGAAALLADPAFPARGEVVLVLHSLAGVLDAAMGQALGARLLRIVHVAAVVPVQGGSFASTMGLASRLILPVLFFTHPKGLLTSPAMIRNQLGNDLPPDQCADLVRRFRPECGGFFLKRVSAHHSATARSYVVCRRDQCVPPALQRSIAHRLGARVEEMDTGHMPMLSRPRELADLLSRSLDALRPQKIEPVAGSAVR